MQLTDAQERLDSRHMLSPQMGERPVRSLNQRFPRGIRASLGVRSRCVNAN
jgi:hypothetical protein